MIKREKVLKGLEHCTSSGGTYTPCNGCPYDDPEEHCQGKLLEEALSLLREQEPRVMTKEEVLATPEGTVVWMEEEAESGTYIQPIVSTGNGFLGNFYIGVGTYSIDSEKRRFWNSHPLPEQMRDTSWEEMRK